MTKTHDTPGQTGQTNNRRSIGIVGALCVLLVSGAAGCKAWDFRGLSIGCEKEDPMSDPDCYPTTDGRCDAGDTTPPSRRTDLICDNGQWRQVENGPCYTQADCSENLVCLGDPMPLLMKVGKCGRQGGMVELPPKMCLGDGNCAVDERCVSITETAKECRKQTGGRCDANSQCLPGSGCENRECRVGVLGVCDQTSDCTSKAVCEVSQCQLRLGEMCSDTPQCTARQVCDKGKCKSDEVGETCEMDADCVGAPDTLTCNLASKKCEVPKCKMNCPAGTPTKDPSICATKQAIPDEKAGNDAINPDLLCIDQATTPPRKSLYIPVGVEGGLRCFANNKLDETGPPIFPIPGGQWRSCPNGTFWERPTDKNGVLSSTIMCRGHRADNSFTGGCGDIGGGIHGYCNGTDGRCKPDGSAMSLPVAILKRDSRGHDRFGQASMTMVAVLPSPPYPRRRLAA